MIPAPAAPATVAAIGLSKLVGLSAAPIAPPSALMLEPERPDIYGILELFPD